MNKPLVQTFNKVQGFKQNCCNFLGIAYTQNRKDLSRWQRYSPASIITKQATKLGNIAPQLPAASPLLMSTSDNSKQSEDCLNLNIYSPDTSASLPVMVWIHGGGFAIGSGSMAMYNGANLAHNENIVVVSINYRLGAFGFLRLCDVTNGAIESTGNEGLFDQITALQWIKQHIHEFGGDSNNVTLFGESAGAMSIACLLAMPAAKGLFHKAILQSGAAHTYQTKQQANLVAEEFMNSANSLGFNAEQLTQLSTTELLSIQQHFLSRAEIYQKFGILPFKPVVDELHLPLPPHTAIAQGSAKNITIVTGSNTDEWTLFAQLLGQNIETEEQLSAALLPIMNTVQIKQCLPLMSTQLTQRGLELTPQHLLNEALTNFWFHQPCHRLLVAQINAGGRAYRYKLGRKTTIAILGCTHIADIGLVFGHPDEHFHGNETRVAELSKQMQQCWGNVAHNNEPNHTRLQWPHYAINEQADEQSDEQTSPSYPVMFFDHQSSYVDYLAPEEQSFWADVTDQQLSSF